MKTIVVLIGSLLIYSACEGQTTKQSIQYEHSENFSGSDHKGSWNVTKYLDEKGTVIAYDSSYIRKGYHTDNTSALTSADTLFNYLRKKMKSDNHSFFDNPFENRIIDSLQSDSFGYDFFVSPEWKSDLNKKVKEMEREMKRLRELMDRKFPESGKKPEDEKNEIVL